MKKIVIIGNSAAGFTTAKTLAQKNHDLEITVISKNGYPFYHKGLLIDYLAGKTKENDIFLAEEKFYQDNSIKLIKSAEVIRIDEKRQNVVLKDRTKINYDFLVIASGQKTKLPDIPGKAKEGVITLNSLDDAKEAKDKLLIAGTICVVGHGDLAFHLANVLADKSKEVKIIGNVNIAGELHEKIELIDNAAVKEIIGESKEVQALKLDSGKAIGTDLILFVGNYIPESDFLKDADFQLDSGYILVDDYNLSLGKTNIFACGSIASKSGEIKALKNWETAANEGSRVAQNIISTLKNEQESFACQKS